MMRIRPQFANGEFYHVYNRGTEKRDIFIDNQDTLRFLDGLREFNTLKPIGSLYLHNLNKYSDKPKDKLVEIIAYCLNPNHFHLILRQVKSKGVSEIMKRVGAGYTCYFNEKYKRTGSLFSGAYKVRHVKDNDYFLHATSYVSLNNRVHGIKSPIVKSSWDEYAFDKDGICTTKPVLEQFKNQNDYRKFALGSFELMLKRKKDEKDLASMLIE